MKGEWGDWLPVNATRNWFLGEPLLDWLDLYGERNGFVPDDKRPGYRTELDMGRFVMEKGLRFEAEVMRFIRERCKVLDFSGEHMKGERDAWVSLAERTARAMEDGVEAVYQGATMAGDYQLCGRADLIVRADVLPRLVAELPEGCDIGCPYVVLDIKFTTATLDRRGFLRGNTMDSVRKAQLLSYSAGLPGGVPKRAFLIARSYKQGPRRCDDCLAMLAPADIGDDELAGELRAACEWARRVRRQGGDWKVTPKPSIGELRPNMGNTHDSPWHGAKSEIAAETRDLTTLWHVSAAKRRLATEREVERWDDAVCNAALFELSEKKEVTLQAILDVNRGAVATVGPERIECEREIWGERTGLEFYVDFEWVSDLDDDFSTMPVRGGRTLIFMIGCGHEEEGEWVFHSFVAETMDEAGERKVIDDWLAHMGETSSKFGVQDPLVFHWAHAEESQLSNAFNSARRRHPDAEWREPNWYDFLTRVVRAEPVVVKGAFAFGLKAFATAFFQNGLISTRWVEGSMGGTGAMVGGWRCAREAKESGRSMAEMKLMAEIAEYNEVDCRVIWELIRYFRRSH